MRRYLTGAVTAVSLILSAAPAFAFGEVFCTRELRAMSDLLDTRRPALTPAQQISVERRLDVAAVQCGKYTYSQWLHVANIPELRETLEELPTTAMMPEVKTRPGPQ